MEHTKQQSFDYAKGECLIYSGNGLCRIDDIREEQFIPGAKKTYYVLHPQTDPKSVIYIPVDSNLTEMMHKLVSADEIAGIIQTAKNYDLNSEENIKARALQYSTLIASCERVAIVKLLIELTAKKEELEQVKKKLYAGDAKAYEAAKKLICEEFSYVLRISNDEVLNMLK